MSTDSSRGLRVAVAGLGFGARVHVPALRGLPNASIVGIAGSSQQRASQVADALAIPFACAGIEPLLDLEPDLVTLALPPDANEKALPLVLAAGIPVICEKPLATSLSAAVALADATGEVPAAIDFQFAELPAFHALKDIVSRGELGAPRHLGITWLAPPVASQSWKVDRARGGGVLSLLGSHALYLIEWLLGPLESLASSLHDGPSSSPKSTGGTHDTVRILARTASGVSVGAWISNGVPDTWLHDWQLACQDGMVRVTNSGRDWMAAFELNAPSVRSVQVVKTSPEPNGDGRVPPFRSLASRFISHDSLGKFHPDIGDGLRVQQLMDAVDRAAADTAWVTIPHR